MLANARAPGQFDAFSLEAPACPTTSRVLNIMGEQCHRRTLYKVQRLVASDIGRIYARMTRRSQLAASGLMQKARGRDLEELFPGFTHRGSELCSLYLF